MPCCRDFLRTRHDCGIVASDVGVIYYDTGILYNYRCIYKIRKYRLKLISHHNKKPAEAGFFFSDNIIYLMFLYIGPYAAQAR